MQKISVVIPESCSCFSELAVEEISKLSASAEIVYAENPLRLLVHEEADVCFLPLWQAPYHFPSGIVISALRKRAKAEYVLVVRENIADSERLLGVPENAKVYVPDQIVERKFAEYFPTIEVARYTAAESTSDIIVMPKIEAEQRSSQLNGYLIHELHPDEFTPATGQGTFAWICKEDNIPLRRLLKQIHCSETVQLCNTERRIGAKWLEKEIIGKAYCSVHPAGHYQLNLSKLKGADVERIKFSSTVLSEWASID